MPQITGIVTDNDTTKTIDFIGTVTNKKQTFYFDERQDGMTIKNEDSVTLTLIVNSRSYQLSANASLTIDERVISFNIVRGATGTSQFSLSSYLFHSRKTDVEDVLTSTNTKSSLSANQGRVLDGKISTNKNKIDIWVDVKVDFGAKGDGVTDDTIAVQNALLYAKTNNKRLYFPSGTYLIEQLFIYDRTYIEGAGIRKTIFKPTVSNKTDFVIIKDAPTQQLVLTNFTIYGGDTETTIVNPNQNMMAIRSFPLSVSPFHGGMWYGVFRNIEIRNFDGVGLVFESTVANTPNQFNLFDNLQIIRKNVATSRCLEVTGQFAQANFTNCDFDNSSNGNAQGLGMNIHLNSGNQILFKNLTSQNCSTPIVIESAAVGVSIENSWFENAEYAITVNNAVNVMVRGNNFANASKDSGGNGTCVKITGSSAVVSIENNRVAGNSDYLAIGDGNTTYIQMKGNYGNNKTKSIVKQRNTSTNTFDVAKNRVIQYNNNAALIKTITSQFEAGETFTILFRTNGGDVTIDNTGNITLPYGKTTITCRNGDAVTFIKSDLGAEYVIISTTTL